MIEKISKLKNQSQLNEVKSLCDNAIAILSDTIYKNVSNEAQFEIERMAINNLFESLSKFDDKETKEWVANQKRLYALKNLGVREAIGTLKETESKDNPGLDVVLNEFIAHLQNGIPEVLLYESFVSAMDSFSYFPQVGTSLDAIKARVENYKCDIDISKILEVMKTTKSSFLVPLIEDVVNEYLNNKTEQTKSSLRQVLTKFTYDKFVNDIVSIVSADATNLQLEYANANCDVEKIYSPLIYIGENEAIFNVQGVYYIKKGNNLNRLHESEFEKLDPDFVNLCYTINNNNIVFEKDSATIYHHNDKAIITEKEVVINNVPYSHDNMKAAYNALSLSGKSKFYEIVESIRNNFDEIAEVNFVKRVYLKENIEYAADIFKLRDNVFITTHDPELGKATFFRNVNPMQAKNIMMEHLSFDVSKAFANILPQEEKILSEISETKKSYNNYITLINEKIDTVKSEEASEITSGVAEALEEELQEVKSEFKDYLHSVEKYLHAAETNEEKYMYPQDKAKHDKDKAKHDKDKAKHDDKDKEKEDEEKEVNEDVTVTVDVDGKKYVVPIPVNGQDANADQVKNGAAGVDVGAEDMAASAVTFDDDESELLSDEPSIEDDEVNLGSDEAEAEADEEEKEAEERDEEVEDEEDDAEDIDKEKEDDSVDKDVEDEEEEDEELDKDQKKRRDGEEEELNDSAEGKGLKREKFVNEKKIRVFLKKKKEKVEEDVKTIMLKKNTLNEGVQIGNDVLYKGKKGAIIGAQGDTWIVQIQGSSEWAKEKELKVLGAQVETIKPPFKFDEKTQKLLFEQYVECGVYMGNTPVKTTNCYVKYSDWEAASDDKKINVMVEGQLNIMPKGNVRIHENVNEFANPENYIEGVILDEAGQATENVMINVEDYTNALGEAEPVRILKNTGLTDIDPETDTIPKGNLRTLSV